MKNLQGKLSKIILLYSLIIFKSWLNEMIYKITNDEIVKENKIRNSLKNLNFQNSFERVLC